MGYKKLFHNGYFQPHPVDWANTEVIVGVRDVGLEEASPSGKLKSKVRELVYSERATLQAGNFFRFVDYKPLLFGCVRNERWEVATRA